MKITDLKVWVTQPEAQGRSFVFLRIDTDEGVSGVGEATSSGGGGSVIVGNMLRFLRDARVRQDFRESLVGEDPADIDRIWHKLFRRFTGGGGYGGFVSTMLSGVDIALWDIKGKALGLPVFRLMGGRCGMICRFIRMWGRGSRRRRRNTRGRWWRRAIRR